MKRALPILALWCCLALAAGAREITMVSWNLQWFPGRIPYAKADARRAHLAATQEELRELNPDLLLAQEITSERAFEDLVSVLPGARVAVVSSFDRLDSPKAQQVAIATRLPTRSAWSAMWDGGSNRPPRGYALTALDLGADGTLLVYNLHLKSNRTEPGLTIGDCVRLREEAVRQLLAHVEAMTAEFKRYGPVAVVVAGDFNTNREHADLEHERTLAMMAEAGFRDGWQDVPPGDRLTWAGSPEFPPCTFDYIFTRGVAVDGVRLITSTTSDHHPVMGRMTLSVGARDAAAAGFPLRTPAATIAPLHREK